MTQKQKLSNKGNLLIIDDDVILADRLEKSLSKRGFQASTAYSVKDAIEKIKETSFDFALIDLRIGSDSGIELVSKIKEATPNCRIVMLTAFGNIATAVAAVKSGAIDYLAKPADADAIENALLQDSGSPLPPPPAEPMTAERVRWEHIQRIYEQCDRNISETARRLKMHRRTLQRILGKYAPRDAQDE
jgi:two-component system response regulator RegA